MYVARKDSFKQAAQARRLLANVKVAAYIVAATIEVEQYVGRSVVLVRAGEVRTIGNLTIPVGKKYYLIACTVAPERFYAVVQNGDKWTCSLDDRNGGQKIIAKAKAYRAELLAAQHAQSYREHVA